MSRTLQQRIVRSKATFPVTVVISLLLWLTGLQWPMEGDAVLAGWWGMANCPVWLVEGGSLMLCLLAMFLLAQLNNAFLLVGHRSTLHTSFFLLLWSSMPAFSHSLGGNLFFGSLAASIFLLFHTYQGGIPVGEVFFLFLFLGAGSLVEMPVLCLIPLLYAGLYAFRVLNTRTFCAGLLGLLLPYWILFTYAFCVDEMALFGAWWQALGQLLVWNYAGVSLSGWLLVGYLIVLFLYCVSYVAINGRRYKIRTRLFLLFLAWWTFFGLLLWMLLPLAWDTLVAIPLLGASLLAGHTFVNSSTRMSNVVFLSISVCLVLMSVYNCVWTLW